MYGTFITVDSKSVWPQHNLRLAINYDNSPDCVPWGPCLSRLVDLLNLTSDLPPFYTLQLSAIKRFYFPILLFKQGMFLFIFPDSYQILMTELFLTPCYILTDCGANLGRHQLQTFNVFSVIVFMSR